MAERKSKRKAPPKKMDDEEPKGLKKALQNPWVLLLVIALVITGALLGIFALARWLSQA